MADKNYKPMRSAANVKNADDAIVAARVLLSGTNEVSDALALRAVGRAGYAAAMLGEEPEILVGMALEARDDMNFRLLYALNAALAALDMPPVEASP